MSKPLNIVIERSNLFISLKQQLQSMKQSVLDGIQSSEEGIQVLKNLSDTLEEKLETFYYISMALHAAEYLNNRYKDQYPNIDWRWHTYTDEGEDVPDLTGTFDGKLVVAVEIDPADKPVPKVSMLMTARLWLLAEYEGADLYYIIRTDRMWHHARMKLKKMNKPVNILNTESLEIQS